MSILLNIMIPKESLERKVTLVSRKTVLINNRSFKNGKRTVSIEIGNIKILINGT